MQLPFQQRSCCCRGECFGTSSKTMVMTGIEEVTSQPKDTSREAGGYKEQACLFLRKLSFSENSLSAYTQLRKHETHRYQAHLSRLFSIKKLVTINSVIRLTHQQKRTQVKCMSTAEVTISGGRLPLKENGRTIFVPLDEVEFFEAARNYVQVHAGTGQYRVRETLSTFAARLPEN